MAAFEAVVLYGLRGTTLEKVGEIAGVSKGVVLHHFKDKGSLLEAVIRRTNGMLRHPMNGFGPSSSRISTSRSLIRPSVRHGYR